MDKKQLQQKIAEYFSRLPKEAQNYFSSMSWVETLKNIELNFNLDEEQIETLGTETTLVLLGIIHMEEYKEVIESEMDLEKDVSDKLFKEIDENILILIKEKLVESFETNALDLAEEKYGGDKKLEERFNSLPKEIQEAINESNYQVNLYSIADKYRLDIEQMGVLEEITTKVMLNIIHPDKYEEELVFKIKISREDISNLVKEINEAIFKNIKEILKLFWDKNNKKEETYVPKGSKPLALDPRFESLPKEVQEAIAKSGWKEKLYEIAPKYKLNIEQMGILEDITTKVMLNIINPDKYEVELASKIIIPREDISGLVKDVNEGIFQKIREEEKITNYEPASTQGGLGIRNEIRDEEVPLPPYAGRETIKNDELGIRNEGGDLIKNYELGIRNEKRATTTTENTNPNTMNPMEEKLKGATVSEHTISDHSTVSTKPVDPYREVF